MREVAPAHALADERHLGVRLDRHLRLDLLDDANDGGARELRERRPAVPEDPRVAVLVCTDRPGEAQLGRASSRGRLGTGVARILEVVLDPVERRLRLCVLDLEPGNDERARPVGAEDECDRPLRRHEGEAGVVEDVVRVEEDDAGEPAACACSRSASQRARCSSGVIAIDVITEAGSLVPWTREGHPTAGRRYIRRHDDEELLRRAGDHGPVPRHPAPRRHGAEQGLPALAGAAHRRRSGSAFSENRGRHGLPLTRRLAERRRSRTDRAVGCTTARVLKTRWATGPMPLRRAG